MHIFITCISVRLRFAYVDLLTLCSLYSGMEIKSEWELALEIVLKAKAIKTTAKDYRDQGQ